MSESVNKRTDGRTHGCRLESHPISSLRAFGSGELKIGEILSFFSEDIVRKQNYGINQGP